MNHQHACFNKLNGPATYPAPGQTGPWWFL